MPSQPPQGVSRHPDLVCTTVTRSGISVGAAARCINPFRAGNEKSLVFNILTLDGPISLWQLKGYETVPIASAAWQGAFGQGCSGENKAMIKSELIARLAEANPHLYQRDVERIVSTVFDEVSAALARGDRVELRGFGSFSVKRRPARVGRNPRTGAAVNVAEKHVPFFKTGKELRERLNSTQDGS